MDAAGEVDGRCSCYTMHGAGMVPDVIVACSSRTRWGLGSPGGPPYTEEQIRWSSGGRGPFGPRRCLCNLQDPQDLQDKLGKTTPQAGRSHGWLKGRRHKEKNTQVVQGRCDIDYLSTRPDWLTPSPSQPVQRAALPPGLQLSLGPHQRPRSTSADTLSSHSRGRESTSSLPEQNPVLPWPTHGLPPRHHRERICADIYHTRPVPGASVPLEAVPHPLATRVVGLHLRPSLVCPPGAF